MMTEIKRREVIEDEVSVSKWIKDGMSIIIGGFITRVIL